MRDHRCLGAARTASLALALLAGACGRVDRGPVAPFGGELATPLPFRDVLGFLRFRPGDELARELSALAKQATTTHRLGVLGPAVQVLEMIGGESSFVAPDEPLVVLFLDSSVHGAFAAFAWRGDAQKFRVAARRAGLRQPAADRVELPGRGRVEGMTDLAMDTIRLRRMSEEIDVDSPAIPRVPYHVIERDGITLLAPARDGVRNLIAALNATHALDPAAGAATCFRFDLGRVVNSSRDELRNAAGMPIEMLLESTRNDSRLGQHDLHDYDGWRSYFQLRRRCYDVLDATLDLAGSIDHLFAVWDRGRLELYVLAEPESFLRRVLPVARNLPVDQLVAGLPADAEEACVASIDPDVAAEIPSIWRGSRRGLFRRQRRMPAGFDEKEPVDPDAPEFFPSFGGRCWLALTSATEDEEEPSALPFTLRVFTELTNDDANEGAAEAFLEAVLPPAWLKVLRLTSFASGVYRKQRVAGGAVEVIGAHAGAIIAGEARRIAEPERVDAPWDGPEQAFWFGRFRAPADPAAFTLFATRDESGVRAVATLPTH